MTPPPDQTEDRFSAHERRALDLWRVPEPAPHAVTRILARVDADRSEQRRTRGFAVAAVALVLIGGALTARRLASSGPVTAPADYARLAPADAGPEPDVNAETSARFKS